MDDGQCGSPVGGRREPDCCFKHDQSRGPGDPAFRALFNEHEKAFLAAAEKARKERFETFDKERRERWARNEKLPNEADPPQLIEEDIKSVEPMSIRVSDIFYRPRNMKANVTPEAVEDLKKLMGSGE